MFSVRLLSCNRSIICGYPHNIKLAHYSSTNRNRKRRNAQQLVKTDQRNVLDDEQYYDRDFDDSRQIQSQKKNFNIKFQDFDSIFGPKHRNALYDDDDDDIKLAQVKRNTNNKRLVKQVNRKFEREQIIKNNPITDGTNDTIVHNKNIRDSIFKKIERRVLIPLPYDINKVNRFDILNQTIIPLYNMPYNMQLKKKYNYCAQILTKFGHKLSEINNPVQINSNGLPCQLEHVRESPRTEQYRNKDEFSVWPGIDGNSKTVGFFVGQPSIHERVVCVEPDHLFITKQSHIELSKKFQDYLRNVSPYDYCQNYGLRGHWRRLCIRSNENDEHMIIGNMNPQDLTTEQLEQEMYRFKQFFSDDQRIRSLYFHTSKNTRSTHSKEPYYHLAGKETIEEQILGHQFFISPSSFFQVNTTASEVLYRVIMGEMNAKRKTIMLDLCCGTGTLSILMGNQVKQIFAIDSSESAINDAKRNASANNLANVNFVVGTVEDVLPKLMDNISSKDLNNVVAVLNPSRRGLHPRAIKTIQRMEFIKRVIYISCKPDGEAFNNFVQLCRPPQSNYDYQPFVPINAVPVDLFPHTSHCELIVTFERF